MSAPAAAALLSTLALLLLSRPRNRRLSTLRNPRRLSVTARFQRSVRFQRPARLDGQATSVVQTKGSGATFGAWQPGHRQEAQPSWPADELLRTWSATDPARRGTSGRRWLAGWLVLLPLVLAITVSALGGRRSALLLAGAMVAGVAVRMRRQARRRSDAAARRNRVIEACDVLSSDLRAGRVPVDALDGAATVCPELAVAVSAARLGGHVPVVLDRLAALPGASGLRALGAAWRVAEQSGAAFAAVAERVADALRGDELVRRQVSAGLAGARATARLLAGLPVLGLGLGQAVGAHPLRFLTDTPVGWLCLLAGLALAAAGLGWVERLADSCEDPGGGAA